MPDPATTPKSDSVRRALRGLFQVGAVTLAIQGYNLFASRPLTADQTAWVTTFGTFLVSFVQNMLEEVGAVPAMLKGSPVVHSADLDDRKLEALAAAIGAQHNDIERLENALLDLRADRGLHTSGFVVPEDPERISTRQASAAPWPPGGLG